MKRWTVRRRYLQVDRRTRIARVISVVNDVQPDHQGDGQAVSGPVRCGPR